MEILSKETHINFVGSRRIAVILSVILIAASIVSLATRKLNLGVDFTGGVLMQVQYPEGADLPAIRDSLAQAGIEDASVQLFGSPRDVLIRLPVSADTVPDSADVQQGDKVTMGEKVFDVLEAADSSVVRGKVEVVGAQVGKELSENGALALVIALMLIFIYVALRFVWKFGAGAVAALIHDVVVVIGFFSLFHLDFDLSVLAAVLAVIGYSLNDTIVVFDRIRENFLDIRNADPEDIVNTSINQMLARTIVTGVTTLLVLAALYFLGGEALQPFSLALIIGIIVGTYSSIYVASSVALALNVNVEDLLPPKIDEEVDALP
ncbi:MAG: protein translocase subunit SecF [Gammaproteobacteria bacterium]|nr:protein translocase subunit SecF [Gammaproteobacteria bacterium]